MRTFSPEVRDKVRDAMERFAQGIAEAHGATATLDVRGGLRVGRQRRAGVRPRRGGGPRGARRRRVLRARADHGRRGLLGVPERDARRVLHRRRRRRGRFRTTTRASLDDSAAGIASRGASITSRHDASPATRRRTGPSRRRFSDRRGTRPLDYLCRERQSETPLAARGKRQPSARARERPGVHQARDADPVTEALRRP